MKQFIIDLLSGKENTPGTKRLIAVWAMLLFSAMVIYHLISHINVQEALIIAVCGLITAPLALNTIISSKDIGMKQGVATEVVKRNPADGNAEDAKDIINPKPDEEAKG